MEKIAFKIKKIPLIGTFIQSSRDLGRLKKVQSLDYKKVLEQQDPKVRRENIKYFAEKAKKINKANAPTFWSKMTNKKPDPKKISGRDLQRAHAAEWASEKNDRILKDLKSAKRKMIGSGVGMVATIAAGATAYAKRNSFLPQANKSIVKKVIQKRIKELAANKKIQFGSALGAGVVGVSLLNKRQKDNSQPQIIPESFEYSGV